jgi:hypothetical protein
MATDIFEAIRDFRLAAEKLNNPGNRPYDFPKVSFWLSAYWTLRSKAGPSGCYSPFTPIV